MKIGLLTVYYSNYGSYFQAISLKKQLEAMGHQCEIINASIRGKYSFNFLLGKYGNEVLPDFITDRIAQRVSDFRTYRAMKSELDNLNISGLVFNPRRLDKKYDCIVVGSDELWSALNPAMHFIPAYFGLGIKAPHFSYGTSAVTMETPPPRMQLKMVQGLRTFTDISVRDKESQNWVKKWTGKTVPIVLDPTLLNPYFASEGKGGGGIMVYGQKYSPEFVQLIQNYAREHDLKIHALCWEHDWCDDFLAVGSAQELQDAFAAADFCAVSTFHGTVFSMLNRRPFVSFSAPGKTRKIRSLLDSLGMGDCLWQDNCRDELTFKGDYSVFNEKLKQNQIISSAYLQQALENAQKICDGKGR